MLADCKLLAMDILRALAVLVLVCGSNMGSYIDEAHDHLWS
jgi:hypothetical protein